MHRTMLYISVFWLTSMLVPPSQRFEGSDEIFVESLTPGMPAELNGVRVVAAPPREEWGGKSLQGSHRIRMHSRALGFFTFGDMSRGFRTVIMVGRR